MKQECSLPETICVATGCTFIAPPAAAAAAALQSMKCPDHSGDHLTVADTVLQYAIYRSQLKQAL
jgi:hypothetical protein